MGLESAIAKLTEQADESDTGGNQVTSNQKPRLPRKASVYAGVTKVTKVTTINDDVLVPVDAANDTGPVGNTVTRYQTDLLPRKANTGAGCNAVTEVTHKSDDSGGEYEFPMPDQEESLIRQWLAQVGEHDRQTVEQVIRACNMDLLSRDFHLRQAWEHLSEDRVTCMQCANRQRDGHCHGVPAGQFPRGSQYWRPDPNIKRRCHYFMVKEGE